MEKSNKLSYLSFAIEDEMFAISVTKVLEVLQKIKITRVPSSPKHVEGVINFRGEIIPIFDTRTKFGLPKRSEADKFVIIVLQMQSEADTYIIGAIADAVKDVLTISNTDINPDSNMGRNFNSDFFEGIAKIDENFTTLLKADKVFLADEKA